MIAIAFNGQVAGISASMIRQSTSRNTGECFQLSRETGVHLIIQLPTFAYTRLLIKLYENEVTLTGQNPPLKCCQHLEIQKHCKKKVVLLMLKILAL